MNARAASVPLWLVGAAAVLALGAALRLSALGGLPLDAAEARHALAAAAAGPTAPALWDPEQHGRQDALAYHVPTAALFGLVGSSDAAARLLPALAGIALLLTPFLLRRELGPGGALAASTLLALSPVLVRASRSAGGDMLGLLGLCVFAIGVWRYGDRLPLWGGLALALGLASGPSALGGALVLALAASVARGLGAGVVAEHREPGGPLRVALLGGLAALLLVGGGFGLRLEALAGLGESLASWARGWVQGGGLGPLAQLAALLAYEPLVLSAGLAGAAMLLAARDPLGRLLTLWGGAGLALALLYPAGAASELVWAVYPMALLGGWALARLATRVGEHASWEYHGAPVAALLVLAGVAGLHLAAYAGGRGPTVFAADPALSLGLAGAVVMLGVVMIVLTAAAWSTAVAAESAALAALAVLLAASLSAGWRLSFSAPEEGRAELWSRRAPDVGVRMLVDSLETVSQAQTGRTDALAVALDRSAPADLRWALRRFRAAPAGEPAPAVLAPADAPPPSLPAAYIGQTLQVARHWDAADVRLSDLLRWISGRAAPTLPDRWLVLVRADLISPASLPADALLEDS